MEVSEEQFYGFDSDDSVLDPNINFNELDTSNTDSADEICDVSNKLWCKM